MVKDVNKTRQDLYVTKATPQLFLLDNFSIVKVKIFTSFWSLGQGARTLSVTMCSHLSYFSSLCRHLWGELRRFCY